MYKTHGSEDTKWIDKFSWTVGFHLAVARENFLWLLRLARRSGVIKMPAPRSVQTSPAFTVMSLLAMAANTLRVDGSVDPSFVNVSKKKKKRKRRNNTLSVSLAPDRFDLPRRYRIGSVHEFCLLSLSR